MYIINYYPLQNISDFREHAYLDCSLRYGHELHSLHTTKQHSNTKTREENREKIKNLMGKYLKSNFPTVERYEIGREKTKKDPGGAVWLCPLLVPPPHNPSLVMGLTGTRTRTRDGSTDTRPRAASNNQWTEPGPGCENSGQQAVASPAAPFKPRQLGWPLTRQDRLVV